MTLFWCGIERVVELRAFWCGTERVVELRAFWCGTEGGGTEGVVLN